MAAVSPKKTTGGIREPGLRCRTAKSALASADGGLLKTIDTTLNENVNVNVFFARAFGDSIVDHIYPGNNANFGFIELNLKIQPPHAGPRSHVR